MISNSFRFQESLDRARASGLESVISTLSGRDGRRPASRRQIAQRENLLFRRVADPLAARMRLERILQGNDLTDVSYLSQGIACARSVCRIVIRRNGNLLGYGTGFLVAPGVLLTNHHVFPVIEDVVESTAQFSYERDAFGRELPAVEFALRLAPEPILFPDLDIAIVAVEPRSTAGQPLEAYSWLKLNPQPGKAFIGEYLTIIQHPNGERKQICVRENKLLKFSENGPSSGIKPTPLPAPPALRFSTIPGMSLRCTTAQFRGPSESRDATSGWPRTASHGARRWVTIKSTGSRTKECESAASSNISPASIPATR